jgi:TetR/AcrR family transcriptional regulator
MHVLACIRLPMKDVDQRIQHAAVREFCRKGYAGATTRKIAEMAGVNEVTLFRRFRSKESILRTSITKLRDRSLQAIDSVFLSEQAEDLRTCLRNLGRSIMRLLKDEEELIFLLISEGRRNPTVARSLSPIPQTVFKRLAVYFEKQIKLGKMRSVDPEIAALTYISYPLFNSLLSGMLVGILKADDEKTFDGFLDIFMNGISN